jgi:hypothetical protein
MVVYPPPPCCFDLSVLAYLASTLASALESALVSTVPVEAAEATSQHILQDRHE